MSNAKWTGVFAYSANDLIISGVMPKIQIVNLGAAPVPISYFSVTGGAERKIKLSEASDLSIASELEQARSYKNIRLYLSPKSVFSTGELLEIALKGLTVGMTIVVSCQVGKTVTQTLMLGSSDAKIAETPISRKDSFGNEYFFVNLNFTESELVHTSPKTWIGHPEKW